MSQRPGFIRQPTDVSLTSFDKIGHHAPPNLPQAGPSTSLNDEGMKDNDEHHGKDAEARETEVPAYDGEEGYGQIEVVSDAKDIVTSVLHVEDDPSLNPWTFRMVFLGMLTWEVQLVIQRH